jgi:hypothetical protein
MTKAKTKMPKLPMSPTQWDWDQYYSQLVQYQKEQLARKGAQIAALKRQNKALQREVKRLRMDPRGRVAPRVPAWRRRAEETLFLEVALKETKY